MRLQLNQPGDGYLAVSAYVKEHVSEISSPNAIYYTPSPQQKQDDPEVFYFGRIKTRSFPNGAPGSVLTSSSQYWKTSEHTPHWTLNAPLIDIASRLACARGIRRLITKALPTWPQPRQPIALTMPNTAMRMASTTNPRTMATPTIRIGSRAVVNAAMLLFMSFS